jgi:hypothetical protein
VHCNNKEIICSGIREFDPITEEVNNLYGKAIPVTGCGGP